MVSTHYDYPMYTGARSMIPEWRLLTQLEKFEGWSYDRSDPKYPEFYGNRTRVLAPPFRTNCSAFVEGMLGPLGDEFIAGFDWGHSFHKDMMIYDRERPFSPIEAIIKAGIATPVYDTYNQDLPPWCVVQGWRSLDQMGFVSEGDRGHTFFIRACSPLTGKALILESNLGFGVHGVGYRGLGRLTSCRESVDELVEKSEWSVGRILAYYRYCRIAYLNITD